MEHSDAQIRYSAVKSPLPISNSCQNTNSLAWHEKFFSAPEQTEACLFFPYPFPEYLKFNQNAIAYSFLHVLDSGAASMICDVIEM